MWAVGESQAELKKVQLAAEAMLSGKPGKQAVLMEGAEHEVRNPDLSPRTLHA